MLHQMIYDNGEGCINDVNPGNRLMIIVIMKVVFGNIICLGLHLARIRSRAFGQNKVGGPWPEHRRSRNATDAGNKAESSPLHV